MVNEFVPLTPRKDDDEDCYCQESSDKPLVSESSDEDTASSSLMPLPDTLDAMRNELKCTINNFGATDYVASPKPNDFTLKNLDFDGKHPTEREVSIVRKITSANLLLDDLLSASNILPKKDNPLVFHSKTVRQRSSPPASESSDPSTGSTSSSENRCPSIPVTSFTYPAPLCECSRYPNENKPEPVTEPVDDGVIADVKKVERKSFLLEKVRWMKFRSKKNKGSTLVSDSQQTQPNYPPPNTVQGYTPDRPRPPMGMSFCLADHRRIERCTCRAEPPERTCHPVSNARKNTRDAKCGGDDALNCCKEPDSNGNSDSVPADNVPRARIPLLPFPVGSRRGKERIDIYYFDHGNSSYYRTTDSHRARFTEYILERTDEYASKFWAEVFGTVTIAIAFVVSFILQLYRFVFTAIVRALTVGLIQIFSDYFFKPLLTIIFNGLIQPCLILGYNIATSTKDFCIPVCEICEFCAKDLAILFGSCRLVEVKQKECSPSCHWFTWRLF